VVHLCYNRDFTLDAVPHKKISILLIELMREITGTRQADAGNYFLEAKAESHVLAVIIVNNICQ